MLLRCVLPFCTLCLWGSSAPNRPSTLITCAIYTITHVHRRTPYSPLFWFPVSAQTWESWTVCPSSWGSHCRGLWHSCVFGQWITVSHTCTRPYPVFSTSCPKVQSATYRPTTRTDWHTLSLHLTSLLARELASCSISTSRGHSLSTQGLIVTPATWASSPTAAIILTTTLGLASGSFSLGMRTWGWDGGCRHIQNMQWALPSGWVPDRVWLV